MFINCRQIFQKLNNWGRLRLFTLFWKFQVLIKKNTLKSAMQMQKFCFVFVGPNFPETFNEREWIAKTFGNFPRKSENWRISKTLRQSIQRRIFTASVYYNNSSQMKEVFENFLGKSVWLSFILLLS